MKKHYPTQVSESASLMVAYQDHFDSNSQILTSQGVSP